MVYDDGDAANEFEADVRDEATASALLDEVAWSLGQLACAPWQEALWAHTRALLLEEEGEQIQWIDDEEAAGWIDARGCRIEEVSAAVLEAEKQERDTRRRRGAAHRATRLAELESAAARGITLGSEEQRARASRLAKRYCAWARGRL